MKDQAAPDPGVREIAFGAFRFFPSRRLLLRDGEPVRVGGRALDILAVLLERPGELVPKRELIARVWPASVVEDSNLKVHVASLRRALGDGGDARGHIVTVSGRGYMFIAPVGITETGDGGAPPAAAPLLPRPLTRTIGRDALVAALAQTLSQRRLLSIVGPGGIGKTTVALAIADAFAAAGGSGACFVDLSRVSDGRFVAGTLAAALGITVHSGDPAQAVAGWLRARPQLVVLDSCENVIDAAAALVDRIATEAPGAVLLATSREPLRIAGEHVHRLAPLDFPPAGETPDAAGALRYAAVQLFVERAAESRSGYRLDDADAPAVAEICRRLEGIALAIELAATRIDAFGATELAARLDDRFRLLRRGRRGAESRHRSLEAALDWSYAFLPEQQQVLLRCLAVFAGSFPMDAAIALLDGALDAAGVVDGVGDLVAKSLLSAELGGPVVRYRLLDTTKAYVLEKLEARGESPALRRRHAAWVLARLAPGGDGQDAQGCRIEDLRAALDWAFGPDGDAGLGLALSVAAIPHWMRLSLVDECRQAVRRALDQQGALAAPDQAMKLYDALAGATLHTRGPLAETGEAWTRALELAETLGDDEYQLRALWGLGMYRGYIGQFEAVAPLAERLAAIARRSGDRAAEASVERLVGTACHSMGRPVEARRHLERMLRLEGALAHEGQVARFQVDQRVASLSVLGNVLWVLGFPDRAGQAMAEAVDSARQAGHTLSLMGALANAACLAVRAGDEDAPALLAELGELLGRNAISVLDGMHRSLRALLELRAGDLEAVAPLQRALAEMRASGFQYRYSIYQAMLAELLGRHGRHAEALGLAQAALDFALGRGEGWCLPELWRIKGELLAAPGHALADTVEAEACFEKALDLARAQQARIWELRAAASLARHERGLGRRGAGHAALAALLDAFDQGLDSADLRLARAALAPED